MDLDGAELFSVTLRSSMVCASKCLKTKNCIWFTYTNKNCTIYGKSTNQPKISSDKFTSKYGMYKSRIFNLDPQKV